MMMITTKRQSKIKSTVAGFTLIEMMVVVFIVAILAAIAIPSYRRYAVQNAESNAKASMKQIQIDLEKWRTSALTYRGFYPKNIDSSGDTVHAYNSGSTSANTLIYLPLGSTASNYHYEVTLVDGTDTTKSLVIPEPPPSPPGATPTATTIDNSTGRSWRMLAVPNSSGITSNANRILLTSTGLQCENTSSTLTISSTDCGTGGETW